MNLFFVGFMLLCTIYALVRGGAPERVGAIFYALAVAATHVVLVTAPSRWQSLEVSVLMIDALLFAAFIPLALRADRFWPIWVTALLGMGLLGHLARIAGPDLFWWAYAVLLTIWSYPILAVLAIGTYCHQRRLKRHGADPAWLSRRTSGSPSKPPR